MRINRVALVAFPFLQIVGECDADALCLHIVGRVDAAGIIEHYETLAQCLGIVAVDSTLVLHELFPPLHVLVVDAQQRFVSRLPLMGLGDVAFGPSHTYVQWCAQSLITSALASDVCHPVSVLERFHLVRTAPSPIYQCRESATLVHVPTTVLERQQSSLGVPCEQVITFGKPCFITAAVGAVFTVVNDIGHIPFAVFAEDSGTVYLMIIVCRCHDHSVFIRCAYLFIYALHNVIANA